jgi:hypothetical protein
MWRERMHVEFPRMKSTIFWDTTCSLLRVNRRYRGTYRLHLQGQRISRARYQRESRTIGLNWLDLTPLVPSGTLGSCEASPSSSLVCQCLNLSPGLPHLCYFLFYCPPSFPWSSYPSSTLGGGGTCDFIKIPIFIYILENRDSSVGIATGYGMDGRGSISGRRDSSLPHSPALEPSQPPIQWVPGVSFPEGKATGAWSWPFSSI